MKFKYFSKLSMVFTVILLMDAFLICKNVRGDIQSPHNDTPTLGLESKTTLIDSQKVNKPLDTSDSVENIAYPVNKYSDYTVDEGEDLWGVFIKLGTGLSVVILLAWGAARLFKKSNLARKFGVDNPLIKLVERTYLSSKTSVILIEISGRTFALGLTDDAISKIAEWQTSDMDLPDETAHSSFANQFKNVLNPGSDGAR